MGDFVLQHPAEQSACDDVVHLPMFVLENDVNHLVPHLDGLNPRQRKASFNLDGVLPEETLNHRVHKAEAKLGLGDVDDSHVSRHTQLRGSKAPAFVPVYSFEEAASKGFTARRSRQHRGAY